jgi:phospholipid/cholesterol/gamma-HCH transport system substrate-binding protein
VITRATLIRVGAFVVLTLVLVIYVGAHFLGAFNFVGPRPYTVMMSVPDASGLFPRGEVTYRGVKVGSLGTLQLTPDGVDVPLVIDSTDTKISSDLKVVVTDRSAVGERYVDLLPASDRGPYLADGSHIAADQVSSPVPVQTVLTSLDKLVATVPLNDLRTTVRELGVAFNGLGPKLQLLLDSTNSLTETASDHLPQTLKLIRDAGPVLKTQNDLSDPITSFSANVKVIAEQLKKSDPDIRKLTRTGPEAGREVSDLIDEAGDGIHRTIRESLTLSQILKGRLGDIRAILQLYPGLAAAVPTLLPGDGTAHLGVVLNIQDPPPCTKGYEASVNRAGTDLTSVPVNFRAYCREPVYAVTDVRGVKPQYPFVNGQPGTPPDWYYAFYTDGPQAGIFGPSRAAHHGHGAPGSTDPAGTPGIPAPGLLGAPASFGDFGLTPGLVGG